MEKTISSQDAPQCFGDLLREVSVRGERYVVEQDGVPLAAVVPIALYTQWKRGRASLFELMREAGEQAALGEDDAVRLVEDVKRAVRLKP